MAGKSRGGKKDQLENKSEVLETIFKERLEEMYRSGLKQGVFAVCSVVLDKLSDQTKTAEDKLSDVESFVSHFSATKEKEEDSTQDSAQESEVEGGEI